MFQFLLRLARRRPAVPGQQPVADAPSWHPERPPQKAEGEARKRFATLLPGSTPSLKAAGLDGESAKEEMG
jgi:hypothetical protein